MLYFVRHGETEDNRAGIIQGWRGGSLTEKGKEQACLAGLIVNFRVRKASDFSQGYVSDFELCSKYETSGVAGSDRGT